MNIEGKFDSFVFNDYSNMDVSEIIWTIDSLALLHREVKVQRELLSSSPEAGSDLCCVVLCSRTISSSEQTLACKTSNL